MQKEGSTYSRDSLFKNLVRGALIRGGRSFEEIRYTISNPVACHSAELFEVSLPNACITVGVKAKTDMNKLMNKYINKQASITVR